MIERSLIRGAFGLAALVVLPLYLLGYVVGAAAVGIGKGIEAWWTDVRFWWGEWHL